MARGSTSTSSRGGSGSGSMSGGGGGGDFGRAVARAAVARMLEAAGFTCAHRSAVDALVDVLLRYVCHLGRAATFHANLSGRAVPNECDVVQFLEEFGAAYQGFAGASTASDRCLVDSGVMKDIIMFVGESNDRPFVRPLPRFPMQCTPPQSAASFAALGRESGMKHVPQWLPAFPEPDTYVRTDMWSEKEVSEVAMPNVGKKLSAHEAFLPAFAESEGEKLDGGRDQDQGQSQKRIVPKERQPVYFRIGIDRKPMVMALNSRSLEDRKDHWFLKEEGKDDRKRRADLILREAMDNPQELTLL